MEKKEWSVYESVAIVASSYLKTLVNKYLQSVFKNKTFIEFLESFFIKFIYHKYVTALRA